MSRDSPSFTATHTHARCKSSRGAWLLSSTTRRRLRSFASLLLLVPFAPSSSFSRLSQTASPTPIKTLLRLHHVDIFPPPPSFSAIQSRPAVNSALHGARSHALAARQPRASLSLPARQSGYAGESRQESRFSGRSKRGCW